LKKILVTGAKGFIGSNTARHFKRLGFQTYGIGHGDIELHKLRNYGLDQWINSDITVDAIKEFSTEFDLIVHCAGSGSVGFSISNPYLDYKKTVDGTLEILEFTRLYSPAAHFIYPSSPAVQGEHSDSPIKEDYIGQPCSPYGYHKKIAENLCQSYSEQFKLKISIVRLFSVYGIGLRKQLLWDAVERINNTKGVVEFWGTGNETRDFIHISDVVSLFELLLDIKDIFSIVNGGTGQKNNINSVVCSIRNLLLSEASIQFNNAQNAGNPIYYWASVEKLKSITPITSKDFNSGLVEYVRWANEE
jgi:UDP-glucose 4-epimerase